MVITTLETTATAGSIYPMRLHELRFSQRKPPPENFRENPVAREAARRMTDALLPENYQQFNKELDGIQFGGQPMMTYEIMPAVRAVERQLLMEHGLAWTPEVSLYMLKRAGGRLAVVDGIYRSVKESHNLDEEMAEARKLGQELAKAHQQLGEVESDLETLEERFTEKLGVDLEAYEAQQEQRDLDREELAKRYSLVGRRLTEELTKLGNIQRLSEADVRSAFDLVQKEQIIENEELKDRINLHSLHQRLEEWKLRKTHGKKPIETTKGSCGTMLVKFWKMRLKPNYFLHQKCHKFRN